MHLCKQCQRILKHVPRSIIKCHKNCWRLISLYGFMDSQVESDSWGTSRGSDQTTVAVAWESCFRLQLTMSKTDLSGQEMPLKQTPKTYSLWSLKSHSQPFCLGSLKKYRIRLYVFYLLKKKKYKMFSNYAHLNISFFFLPALINNYIWRIYKLIVVIRIDVV